MKKLLCAALLLCLLLSACGNDPAPAATPESTPAATPTPVPTQTPEPTPDSTATDLPLPSSDPTPVPPLPESTPEPPSPAFEPYILMVENPAQPIYEGPGYDESHVGIVRIATAYTIVDEATDYEGNLWGRLKSGAGWIDLDSVRSWDGYIPPFSAWFVDTDSADYYEDTENTGLYMYARFLPWEHMTDISFRSFHGIDPEGTMSGEVLSIPCMEVGKEYTIALTFPSDFSEFLVTFTTADGTEHRYTLVYSLRNGELNCLEYSEYA